MRLELAHVQPGTWGTAIVAHNVGTSDAEGGGEPERLILVQNFFEELKRAVSN